MNTKRLLFAILGMAVLASACERTTSVGAVGPQEDAGADAAPDADADAVTDADTSDRPPDTATPTPEDLCTRSGGTVTTSSYCVTVVAPFPNTCAVGGCTPENSHAIPTCSCPGGTCFSPGVGCITP